MFSSILTRTRSNFLYLVQSAIDGSYSLSYKTLPTALFWTSTLLVSIPFFSVCHSHFGILDLTRDCVLNLCIPDQLANASWIWKGRLWRKVRIPIEISSVHGQKQTSIPPKIYKDQRLRENLQTQGTCLDVSK
jgi:hypothetical protein